jgi:hypothetical protein
MGKLAGVSNFQRRRESVRFDVMVFVVLAISRMKALNELSIVNMNGLH